MIISYLWQHVHLIFYEILVILVAILVTNPKGRNLAHENTTSPRAATTPLSLHCPKVGTMPTKQKVVIKSLGSFFIVPLSLFRSLDIPPSSSQRGCFSGVPPAAWESGCMFSLQCSKGVAPLFVSTQSFSWIGWSWSSERIMSTNASGVAEWRKTLQWGWWQISIFTWVKAQIVN